MKLKINILVMSFALMCFFKANGQSLPMYSQYMYNMTNINPAYAGNRGVPSLAFIWREQWAGMPGSPSTKSITFDMPTQDKKIGLGIQLIDDRYVDIIRRTGMNLYYNLKFPVAEKGVLSMGLKAGFYNDLKLLTSVYTGEIKSYDIAYASNFNKIVPLAGAGVYYNDDRFYIGFSAPDVITFANVQTYKSDSSLYQVNDLHYFLTAGYSINLNEDVQLKPSFLLKAVSGAPVEVDFNANVWMKNLVGLGMSYRTKESILAMAEAQLTPQFRVGYAYDMPFKMPNSHELFLRMEIGSLFPNNKTIKIY